MPFLASTCLRCQQPVREWSARNSEPRTYDLDGARHRCMTEHCDVASIDLEILAEDEILRSPEWPDDRTVRFRGVNGRFASITIQEGKTETHDTVSHAELRAMGLVRTGAFAPDRPLPEHSTDEENGWLSPDGTLYPCQSTGHITLAGDLERHNGTDDIEEDGFIKLLRGRFMLHALAVPMITQRQFDTIADYYVSREASVPATARHLDIGSREQIRAAARRRRA